MNENDKLSSIALANIEALASGEATSAKYCFEESSYEKSKEKEIKFYSKCPANTSSEIFKCPGTESFGYPGDRDRCTP